MSVPRLSIVVPVLDEAPGIAATLAALAPLRAAGHEVIVVDGGSHDDTVARARPLADRVIGAARGRASQMNAGAAIARHDVVLFLHADTRLPPEAERLVLDGLARSTHQWGRFDVTIEGRHPMLAVIAFTMNLRSRIVICGLIAEYNAAEPYRYRNLRSVLVNRIRMQGMIVFDWKDRYDEAIAALAEQLAAGKLKYRESVIEGIENAPRGLIGLLHGDNFGKQLVKLD